MRQLAVLLMVALMATAVNAQMVSEQFAYSDGDLTTVSAGVWTAHSGAGTGPVQCLSEEAILNQGVGSEDVNTRFLVQQEHETYYAGFDVRVTGAEPPTEGYFAHFMPPSSYYYRSRVFVTDDLGDTGNFTFGFDASSSTMDLTWPTDLLYDVTYRVVISVEYDTDLCSMWVYENPPGSCPPWNETDFHLTDDGGYPGTAADGFGLRQTTGNTSQYIDNLCIGKTFEEAACCIPEPATITLLGLGGLALLRRRR